ncbi:MULTISPECIES: GNAT family N-acetyltransferase [unclassified Photorhabdus]|uniref:GNAT family N-acetyltransferase n=1 Tax=unclassified Photorhabdus TaxID=2620880 RepID=UPI000DCF01D5|nr:MULTISPECIES: GNAT family N-acetyltransferase [unclassified Photorhabdus]RAX01421.1 GNAT family N-acetyltransferase [Photorhabdus sp. S9-53]RAX01978.1 GNAT family N-acetyltransferase [Photorhabdus sp. S10-54]RAX05112.1 GNAT family N-acetyltransferase [Photorhabdus sp. S8-52]
MAVVLETDRLIMRAWREEDRLPFCYLNSNVEVMEYFPTTLTAEQSNTMVDRIIQRFEQQGGWGLWAVELKETGDFIGFVGLNIPIAELPFSPCVEIAWRLNKPFWGRGYANEAARKALNFAFTQLKLEEIVAFTTISNLRSQKVMERLGMVKDENTFLHPSLPDGHPLHEHVLYRIRQ